MRPIRRPRSSSGTQITLESRSCITLLAAANSRSCMASEMISGRRAATTLATIESESWLTASAMFSRRRLRATLTSRVSPSIRIRKPLSAVVISMTRSISVSSSSPSSRFCMSRSEKS
jgi:hypothetical protein